MAIRKYRVREGFTYGPEDQYKAGTIVELDEETARFEMDKLELAEIVQNVPPPPEEPLDESLEETTVTPKARKSSRKSGD